VNNPGIALYYDAPGQIQGSKWHDLDWDGTWDSGEPSLAGWTIYLDQNQDGVLDASEPLTLTGPDGSYAIEYLSAQTYYVAEVELSGWCRPIRQPSPSSDSGCGPDLDGRGLRQFVCQSTAHRDLAT